MRNIWVVADDFGISPAVNGAIIELLLAGRLSGTGCMTLFPEWRHEARRLRDLPQDASIGLHITLTDQKALTGVSRLAPDGILPGLRALLTGIATGRIDDRSVHAEISAQFDAFRQATGKAPAYIDGHQHVHFLPPVRRWLARAGKDSADLPWLRGAPALPRPGSASFVKVATVRTFARGFGSLMKSAGYAVRTPLAGFYDWTQPDAFAPMAGKAFVQLPEGAVFMCHPGEVDATLASRDPLTEARRIELDFLRSADFSGLLERCQARVAR